MRHATNPAAIPSRASLLRCGYLGLLMLGLVWGCQSRRQALIDDAPMVSVQFSDATQTWVRLQTPPLRVVSLAPNLTELIYEIGGAGRLVAVSEICDYPPQTEAKQRLPLFIPALIDSLSRIQPDVVLLSDQLQMDFENFRRYLQSLGIQTAVIPLADTDSLPKFINILGQMLGCQAKAQTLADSLANTLTRYREATLGSGDNARQPVRVVAIRNLAPLTVVGGGEYFNELLRHAGGTNALGQLAYDQTIVTAQQIQQAQPDFLLLLNRADAERINELAPELANVGAVQAENLFSLQNGHLAYSSGLRTLYLLDELARILHPSREIPPLNSAEK
jgi:iron complex transport system substrate-binding protein